MDGKRIDEMTAKAEDPVVREMLIFVRQMTDEVNKATGAQQEMVKALQKIDERTEAAVIRTNGKVEAVDLKLSGHIVAEEIFMAGIKGRFSLAVYIGPFLFTLLSGVGIYLWSDVRAYMAEQKTIKEHQIVNEEIIARLRKQVEGK